MPIRFLADSSHDNQITIEGSSSDPLLRLYQTSNGAGSQIEFSDQTSQLQFGEMTFYHSDGSSYGSGASFQFTSAQGLSVLADGKLLFKDGLYLKPASGTGTTGSQLITSAGAYKIPSIVNAGTDTDKFLVLDSSGNVDFRTGAEVRSDIGAGTGDGTITAVASGAGLQGGATSGIATLAVDYAGTDNYILATPYGSETPVGADTIAFVDSDNNVHKGTISSLPFTDNLGTVTSVAISGGTGISVSGSPITSSGTITITNDSPNVPETFTEWVVRDDDDDDKTLSGSTNKYLKFVAATGTLGTNLSGTGTTADPYVMTITSPDSDSGGTVTSVSGTGSVNGITLTGTVTSSGDLTLGGTLSISNDDWSGADLSIANGGTGASTAAAARTNLGVVNDTGTPAILSDGTSPSLNTGITAAEVRTLIGAGTSSTVGTVTEVNGAGTVNGLTLTGTVTSSGDLTLGGTLSISNDDWSGADLSVANGGTGASTAAAAITNLGATTVGGNLFTLTNPSAIRFIRINANNTVSALSASDFRTAIGAGTGGGSVTSIATTAPITGGTITGSGTIGIDNASGTTPGAAAIDAGVGIGVSDSNGVYTITNAGMIGWTQSADSGTSVSIANGGTVDLEGGNNISTTIAAGVGTATVTFDLDTGGAGAGTYGSTSNSTKIDTITLDAYGRVTAVATGGTGSGSMSTWKLTGDSGGTATIDDGETVDIAGGTNISTARSGNTVTITNGITNNNQLTNGAGYTTNAGNTITSGATVNRVPRFSGSVNLANSSIFDNGTNAQATGDFAIEGRDLWFGAQFSGGGGKRVMSTSDNTDTLKIGDTEENDDIQIIQLKAVGSTLLQVEDSLVEITAPEFGLTNSKVSYGTDTQVTFSHSGSTTGLANGDVIKIGTTAVTAGLIYCLNSNSTWTAVANTSSNSKKMLCAATGTSSGSGMLMRGILTKASHGFTVGSPLYISSSAGSLTNTTPSATNSYARVVGYAVDTNNIYFCPDNTWVQNN